MNNRRSIAVMAAGALIGGTVLTAQAHGDDSARKAIHADLTAISCDVLTHDHEPDSLLRADAVLRAVVRDLAAAPVLTPAARRRTDDSLVLALAAEALERFGEPSDELTRVNAARTATVIAELRAGRTGPDTTDGAWFFGAMPDRTVDEGSTFEVALGVCPDVVPEDGTTIAVVADGDVLAAPAFELHGDTLEVRTRRHAGDRDVTAQVTIVATTPTGLTSIADFTVTLRPVATRAAAPAPVTTQVPTTVPTTSPLEPVPTDAPAPPAVTTTSTTTVPPTTTSTTTTTTSPSTTSTTTSTSTTTTTTEPPTTTTSTTTTTTTTEPSTSTTTTTTVPTTAPPTDPPTTDPPATDPAAVMGVAANVRRQLGRRRPAP